MAPKIDQKEYLKRYLSNDPDKKKKKKKKDKHPTGKVNVRIIDDDVDVSKIQQLNEDDVDLFALGEEAPQVVGIIDERPPELKAKEDFSSNKWKVIASDDGFDSRLHVRTIGDNSAPGSSLGAKAKIALGVKSKKREADSDESPPRRNKDTDASPPRRRRNSDESPPRRRKESSASRNRGDSDESPPKRRKESRHEKPSRRRSSSDESPPRRSQKDCSPKRRRSDVGESSSRQRQSSDESPPRKRQEHERAAASRRRRDSDESPPRNRHRRDESTSPASRRRSRREDSDGSPPRRRNPESRETHSRKDSKKQDSRSSYRKERRDSREFSETRKRTGDKKKRYESDESPPRPSRRDSPEPANRQRHDSDESPPRRKGTESRRVTKTGRRNSDESPRRRIKREPDESPPPPTRERMTKTLDGKTAGLQDARSLRDENDKFKSREDEFFNTMSAEVSGRYAETVVREKSGRRRDIEKELREEFEKRKKDDKKKELYTRWGKGVKQTDDYKARLEEDAYEMSKPLARYADDQDLDEYLKKQERSGDPMLDYLRSKRKEERRKEGVKETPTYQGDYPENRFGIRPGYRWDGVDRSNGFEKRWFEMQSKKKANLEEAYKYSVEDM